MNVFSKVTLRTLGKNRVRTLVTIIGIILSAAMITAVTTSISSLQKYLVDVSIERSGNWHGVVYNLPKAEVEALQQESEVKAAASLQILGYASLESGRNSYKPYLFVAGMSENFPSIMPVNLTSGRMPQNPSEILLPTHLRSNGGVNHVIGDSLSLAIGNRVAEGNVLTQNTGYLDGEQGITETLEVGSQRTYTVVGFYERPTFEDYSAPGFTALTVADESDQDPYEVYIHLKSPRNVYSFLEERFTQYGSSTNSDLLRFIGASNERSFNAVLYGLAAVLIALIMFGSISLIYNAFSISVSERTMQFGLLSSIGATRRQLMQSVLYEAIFLSLVGIPLGILAGIAGIAVTFSVASEMFKTFLFFESSAMLRLFVSWPALIAALIVALATVMISAYLPAKRAVKVS
ncbi:MAG TPA: ABC transporter permease, partial [Anaerolineaceae bacterium]|nr:ABC transporter permease [Anaerolineaceae bacterium]